MPFFVKNVLAMTLNSHMSTASHINSIVASAKAKNCWSKKNSCNHFQKSQTTLYKGLQTTKQ